MRLALVADLHGCTPPVPPCDVLVIAGDVSPPEGFRDTARQTVWFETIFAPWLERADAAHVVAIAGNHDQFLQGERPPAPAGVRWTYLEDSACTIDGVKFWGSPWTPWFHGMAFNAPEIDGEKFLRARFAAADGDTDVLVLHGPPAGYGDVTAEAGAVGSQAARDLITRLQPNLCVFGHVHEGRGTWRTNGTLLVNAAAVDHRWQGRPDPFVLIDV